LAAAGTTAPGRRLVPGRDQGAGDTPDPDSRRSPNPTWSDPRSDGSAEHTRTEANRKIITQAFDAWHKGTGAITDVFAPNMVWRIEEHSLASKEYKDKHQFIDDVLRPFGARFATSDPFRPDQDPIGPRRRRHGDRSLGRGRGIANDGQPYENDYAWFMRLHEGKVIDGTAFYDRISFNDLWTRVQSLS
jgi:uncharacterized protein